LRNKKENIMKISVVMPVFNEEKTIADIVKKIQNIAIDKEIIIVDDGSTDGTRDILKKLKEDGIKIFYHDRNSGKGAALKTGFSKAEGDIIIIQDADLEYDPSEYHNLIEPIITGHADVVYGSRLSGGRPQRVYMFWHKVGNNILTLLTNILYNTTLTDMETGYKVFRKEVVKDMNIVSKGFSVEPELTAKIFKKRLRVYELPISYYGRNYSDGKKIKWYHALSAIWVLIKYKFID
jgi:glycosyltransferase involved in cell wall biosynthesis